MFVSNLFQILLLGGCVAAAGCQTHALNEVPICTRPGETGCALPADDWADSYHAGTVMVTVSVAKPGGQLLASLVRGEDGWASDDPVEIFSLPADSSSVSFEAAGLPPGLYAVKMFQDLDGDGKLSTNRVGIPTEPYAFSNNAAGRFGPPGFAAAAFEVTPGGRVEQAISLP